MSDDREQRNAIFNQQSAQPVSPGIQTVTSADRMRADFGLDIPVEIVPLPSGGRVYPAGSSLHNRDKIEIRAMTTREEDILMSRALLKKGAVISELIRSCIVDKTIDPLDMLTGDRSALMVAVRITGYGPEYEAEVTCPECDVKFTYAFDLGALPIQRLSLEPYEKNANVFEFMLPYTKKPVLFKFLTGRDEEEITATAAKQKKVQIGGDNTVTASLMHQILKVGDVTDRAKIANFVRNMPARDSLALRNYIRNNEPGIVMRQDVVCSSCGHMEETSMPIGVQFLWPGAGR
jgi:hypothetical protein